MTNDKYLNDETPLIVLKMFGKFIAKEKPELLDALRSCLGKTAFTPVNKEDSPKLKEAFQEFLPYQRRLLEEDNAILSETVKNYFFDEETVESVEEEKLNEQKNEMNFGKYDESKIRELGKLWEKGDKIRFYFKFEDVQRMLDITVSAYGQNGMSHSDVRKNEMAFWSSYFDAVKGRFVFGSAEGMPAAYDLEQFCRKGE
ncbi:hypothetical protein [Parasutterella excrementihominis]|uniref:hypothetical protein n=1 Tax=Parasutterella excrementihominis TaxID=487175 RepID=UPI003FEF0C8E